MRHVPCFTLVLVGALLTAAPQALACDYVLEPLIATMPSHDVVLVGRLTESGEGRVRIEVLRVVQGRAGRSAEIPVAWRDPCGNLHGLDPGRLYLLALDRGPRGTFRYSSDGPNPPIIGVPSTEAAVVEAAALMNAHHRALERPGALERLWAAAPDSVRLEVVLALYETTSDTAFVPVLRSELARYADAPSADAPSAGAPSPRALEWDLARWALAVVARHRYRDAIPEARRLAAEGSGLHGEAVWALARLRDPQAFERFRASVEDEGLAVDLSYVTALGELGDPRAVPLLIDLLDQATASEPAPTRSSHPPGVLIAHALARLHAPQAVAPILRYFDAAPLGSKADVVSALREMGAAAASAIPVLETIHERVENEAVARRVRMYADGALHHIREAVSAANAPPLCPCTSPAAPTRREAVPHPPTPSPTRVRLRGPLRLGPEHDLVRRADPADPADAEVCGPRLPSLADLDGDGDDDLVIGTTCEGHAVWYPFDSDAGFGPARPVWNGPESLLMIAALDLDGDGDTDLLAWPREGGALLWLANDGHGTFAPPDTASVARDRVYAVTPADFDNDGDTDLLASGWDRRGAVGLENASGTLTPRCVVAGLSPYGGVAAADIDGDGWEDLVTGSLGSAVAWYRNADGRGAYCPADTLTPASARTSALRVGDLDGDGDLDVLASVERPFDDGQYHGTLTAAGWYENRDGRGRFGPRRDIASSERIRYERLVDLDGDGDLDLVGGLPEGPYGGGPYRLVWFPNRRGRFGAPQSLSGRRLSHNAGLLIHDLDGDGVLEVVVTSADQHGVWWARVTKGGDR